MKKRAIPLFLILCLCLSLLAACQKQEAAPAAAEPSAVLEQTAPVEAVSTDGQEDTGSSEIDPPVVTEEARQEQAWRFADHEAAAALLLEERAYYENLNQNDLNYRMQKTDATLEELEAYLVTQTLDFSEEEKSLINEDMDLILSICEERGYHLPALENVVFAKTTMNEECGAGAYTHGAKIFLGEAILSYGLSEEPYYREYFRYILAHELFHCLTRNDPTFRSEMYALLGFTVVEEDYDFPEEIRNVIISNPDVEHHNSYAAFELNGEMKDCVVIFTTAPFEQPGDSFFDEMQTGLVPIDDLSVMYPSEQAANFWDVFGQNTQYVIDPEETLADNFSYTVIYGTEREYQTPELIRAIDAYLKGRE